MAAVNRILEEAIAAPYLWGENDCVSLVERVHGVRRPAWMRGPEAAVRERSVWTWGGVLEGYEEALRHMGMVPRPGRVGAGMVAVIALPAPLEGTLGLYDDARAVRYRIGDRVQTLQPGHRLRSVWGPA